MSTVKGWFLLTILLLLSASCNAEADPVQESNFEVINLQISSTLVHWLPDVAICADKIPNFGISTQVLPHSALSLDSADLILRIGERMEDDPFVAVMGSEELVIVIGSDVPVKSLSLASLQSVFAGTTTHWEDIPELKPNGTEINQAIQTLAYPQGHILRTLFQETFLGDQEISSAPQIYATPESLFTHLEKNPLAIGFTLKSQVPAGVRLLFISDTIERSRQFYVLAIIPEQPQGKLEQLLLCLQNPQ